MVVEGVFNGTKLGKMDRLRKRQRKDPRQAFSTEAGLGDTVNTLPGKPERILSSFKFERS